MEPHTLSFIKFLQKQDIVGLRESLDGKSGSLHIHAEKFAYKNKLDSDEVLFDFKRDFQGDVETSDTTSVGGGISKYLVYTIPKISPLQKRFDSIKSKYPNAVLLFRVGDYYETFDADAELISEVLSLPLIKRDIRKLAGFPSNDLDQHLPALVKSGNRVAICDELSAPSNKSPKSISRLVS